MNLMGTHSSLLSCGKHGEKKATALERCSFSPQKARLCAFDSSVKPCFSSAAARGHLAGTAVEADALEPNGLKFSGLGIPGLQAAPAPFSQLPLCALPVPGGSGV